MTLFSFFCIPCSLSDFSKFIIILKIDMNKNYKKKHRISFPFSKKKNVKRLTV